MADKPNESVKSILHVDLDAFFASVEQLDNPQYRGKPVIVGGLPNDKRSVVSTCSYEARKFGVHSAMPIAKAYQLCPQAVYLRGRMERYLQKSEEVMQIFYDFSPDVWQMSIDEAFIDITGTEKIFGKPEETAQRIKKTITEKTGLTISVGLASNKYIAKIASGMSKPNGFFCIPCGKEENFMLSLPVNKIWGAGAKTIARLKSAGLFTVEQIHTTSLAILKSILGNAGGQFIFNAVRGLEAETFSEPTKTHSISSEQTFLTDIHDPYSIESALMQLSQEVMFRLLREKCITKTVQVKIRYDDFLTVSIQETLKRPICTSDDFFEHIKHIFYKKWENGHPIRLLGVAAQHVTANNNGFQEELFDFGDQKIKRLEKTVIELQQKNPKLTLQKARLLKKITPHKHIYSMLMFFSFFFSFVHAQDVDKIVLPPLMTLPKEAPSILFQYKKNSTEVDFFSSGFWDASLSYSAAVVIDADKKVRFETGIPIFAQKADFSLSVLLNKAWYFETAIADNFEKSSLATGYLGEGIIKHIRVGSSGIFFPEYYSNSQYLYPSSQENIYENTAPGILGQLSGNTWNADFMLRYDSAKPQEKYFSGANEINKNNIYPHNYDSGKRFTLPNQALFSSIKAIFVEIGESETGTDIVYDQQGRKYKRLTSSEFLILPSQNQIILSKKYTGKIAASFFTNQAIIENQLGAYRTPNTTGNGFLGETEQTFGRDLPEDQRPFLQDFSHKTARDFFITVNGNGHANEPVLLLQDPPLFSPFAILSKYKTTSVQIETSYLVNYSTGIAVQNYTSQIMLDDSAFTEEDTRKKYLVVEVFSENASSAGYALATQRFPFAAAYPLVYLQNQTSGNCDIVIQTDIYSDEERLEIGKNAVPGSIRIYRNGILDGAFDYNQIDGTIRMHASVSPFDKIKITWMENTSQFETGTLSLAAGYKMDITKSLAFDVSVHGQWNFSEKKYNYTGNTTPASSNIYSGLKWKDYGFEVENIVQAGIEIENTTGVYRIFEINDTNIQTSYLGEKTNIELSPTIIPSINTAPYPTLLDSNKGTLTHSATSATGISGYAIELTWDMNAITTPISAAIPAWVSINLALNANAITLQTAERFDFALKTETPLSAGDYTLYLQLGVQADDEIKYENATIIPTWEVKNINYSTTNWQTVSVHLSDSDRAKLSLHHDARIIIVQNTKGSGKFLIGPYEIVGSTYNITADNGTKALIENRRKMSDTPPLNLPSFVEQDSISILSAAWQAVSASPIAFSRFIPEVAIKSYDTLQFYLYIPQGITNFGNQTSIGNDFSLIMRRQTEYGIETALALTLPKETIEQLLQKKTWCHVVISLSEQSVSIDGKKLSFTEASLFLNKDYSPTEIIFQITPQNNASFGKMYFSEFYLEGNKPQFSFSDSLAASWKKNGNILQAGNFSILSSPSIYLKGTGKGIFHNGSTQFAVSGEGRAAITITGVNLSGNIYRAEGEENIISSAGHSISTAQKGIELSETFHYSDNGNTSHKREFIKLSIPSLPQPISTAIEAQAERNGIFEKQLIKNDTIISIPIQKSVFSLRTTLQASQQIKSSKIFTSDDSSTYGQSWMNLSTLQFSDGSEAAIQRLTSAQITPMLSFTELDFFPSFSITASTVYQTANTSVHTDKTQYILTLPFNIDQHTFSFVWTKQSGAEKNTVHTGGNYQKDAQDYFASVQYQPWTITMPIFFDLFYPQIRTNMQNSIKESNSALHTAKLFYTTQYAFSWDRILYSSFYDLFVPNRTNVQFSRDIQTTTLSASDIYKSELTVYFTSFNLFGLFSPKRLMKWFEQDEIRSSHTIKMQFEAENPLPKEWSYNTNIAIILYFKEIEDYLSNTFSFEIFTADKWRINNTILWSRYVKSSFLTDAFAFLFPKVNMSNIRLSRDNNLKYLIQRNNNFFQEILLNHVLTVHINKNINLKFTGEGIFLQEYNDTFSITINIIVAGKIVY